MAGCSIIFILFVILPVFLILAAIVLGIAFGSLFTAITSTIAWILLTTKGIFCKYLDSENKAVHYTAFVVRILLLLTMIGSWLLTAGCVILYLVYNAQIIKF